MPNLESRWHTVPHYSRSDVASPSPSREVHSIHPFHLSPLLCFSNSQGPMSFMEDFPSSFQSSFPPQPLKSSRRHGFLVTGPALCGTPLCHCGMLATQNFLEFLNKTRSLLGPCLYTHCFLCLQMPLLLSKSCIFFRGHSDLTSSRKPSVTVF